MCRNLIVRGGHAAVTYGLDLAAAGARRFRALRPQGHRLRDRAEAAGFGDQHWPVISRTVHTTR